MEALRTPDDRFDGLPGWSFRPHYLDDLPGFEGLRVHHADEGEGERTFLCLHGQPTWAYLYRKMIPILAREGRVIAPDWLGMGRSDKPVDDDAYGFHFHRDMMLALVERLDLRRITLVVQDWGGLIGLTLPMEAPERYERLIVMNTALATGRSPGEGFEAWRAYSNANPDLDVAALMKRAVPALSGAEAEAYAAPFPDVRHKAAVRRFPRMVMTSPEMEGVETSKRAVGFWRDEWAGESFMAIGAQDPVLGPDTMERMRTLIRGCPEPLVLSDVGHFVQEAGDQVAEAALAHFAKRGG